MPTSKVQLKKRNPPPTGYVSWWPVAAGVVLGCLAPQLRSLLASYEPWGPRVVFPFVEFVGLHEIGMSAELTRTLPQLMLYLQFPLEGLLTKSNLGRSYKISSAVGQLVFLHAVCVFVLWLVALGGGK
jgi:hypothetical protein